MARNISINVTDATGGTIGINREPFRDELIIRNGPTSDTVWMAWNEPAVASQGIYLEAGDALILNSSKRDRRSRVTGDVYFVCEPGESATVYADITT